MSEEFVGIKGIRSVGGGCLYVYWDTAMVSSYNVYIREGNSNVFEGEYLWANVRNDIKSVIIRTEANTHNFLRNGHSYYAGVRSVGGLIDTNNYVKRSTVVGDGSQSVEAPDRKIAKVG